MSVDINKLLLNQQDDQKIKLLVFLKENPNTSLYNFYLAQNLPYNKILYIYHKLIADLKEMTGNPDKTISELIEDFSFDEYRHAIFKQQIGYQLLMSLMTQDDKSVAEFLKKNDVSRTKLYRVTTELRKTIANFGVNVNLSEFSIEGNEVIVQSFLLVFLNETETKINEFMDSRWESLVKRFCVDYLTPDGQSEGLLVNQRQRMFAICLLRLTQGYRYQQLNPFPDNFKLDLNSKGAGSLLDFFELNYNMTAQEAHSQVDTLQFYLKFGSNFIVDLNHSEKDKLLLRMNDSKVWRSLWQNVEHNTSVGLVENMELRIYSDILVTMYFGELSISRNNYVNTLVNQYVNGKETPLTTTEMGKLSKKTLRMIEEFGMPHPSNKQLKLIALLVKGVKAVLSDLPHHVIIYMLDDTFDAESDFISYLFQGIVKVLPFGEYKSGDAVSVLEYNEETEQVKTFLKEHDDVIGFHWIHQLPLTENYSRLLLLINKHRFELLKALSIDDN